MRVISYLYSSRALFLTHLLISSPSSLPLQTCDAAGDLQWSVSQQLPQMGLAKILRSPSTLRMVPMRTNIPVTHSPCHIRFPLSG